MSAPKVTEHVLTDPEVILKRKLLKAVARDWLDEIARVAVREHVREPDDLPVEYLNELADDLALVADVVQAAEQAIYLYLGADYDEWAAYNTAAVARGRAA